MLSQKKTPEGVLGRISDGKILTADIALTEGCLIIPNNVNVSINLNGHRLSRSLSESSMDGSDTPPSGGGGDDEGDMN